MKALITFVAAGPLVLVAKLAGCSRGVIEIGVAAIDERIAHDLFVSHMAARTP